MIYYNDKFLLKNKTAEKLYNEYAKNMPIFDYHCHLSEKELLQDEVFKDIYTVWLGGDHYKWRLMRNFGIDEKYITGDATNKEKFVAYCKALGTAFGNPLYHWSQVELKEFFNCEIEIREENADLIWDWCNEFIKVNELTPSKLLVQSKVTNVFTTNEMFDDLTTFTKLKEKFDKFTVIPAFRGDKILNVEAKLYKTYIEKLADCTFKIGTLTDLEKAVEARLNDFIKVGTTAADFSLEYVNDVADKKDAEKVFDKAMKGEVISIDEANVFKGYFTYYLLKLFAKYDIRTEIHVGAMRNNNTAMLDKLGFDTGFDSISDRDSTCKLSRLFDKLNSEDCLPKCILFNLNPKMNAELMALIGCFQDGSIAGKMQYGPAWWFLDNKAGMEKHLSDLTATGHIGVFLGMLTDSRSFLSYPRHHYFRRILCSFLGEMMERGEMTNDIEFVGKVVKDISYYNSMKYFKMM